MKTIVREQFMFIVDREVSRIWKEGKIRIQNKAEFLAKKFLPVKTEPEVHKGIIVGDKLLEETEDKHEDGKDKVPIYGQ